MDAIFVKLVLQIRRLLGAPAARASALFPTRPVLLSATEPVLDRAKVVRQGWCLKESDHLKVWRRRWLVLTRQRLCTFKTDDSGYTAPTSSIDMSNAICSATSSTTIVVRELRDKGSSQENPLKVYALKFSDPLECRAWLAMLHECIMAQDAPRSNLISKAWEALHHTKE